MQSSPDFYIDGCDFYSIDRQKKTGFELALICPERHYARKNIGYLIAIKNGAEIIVDTDDDNLPYDAFWNERVRQQTCRVVDKSGWVNIYQYFTDKNIWPRGLPLNQIRTEMPPYESLLSKKLDAPIQQGLADEDPDLDAICRLVDGSPLFFQNKQLNLALAQGVWSPINSQNTTWWKEVFPLLYLPAYCSFRMTDIYRGFVAQRIAWLNNWHVVFHGPTVRQERNIHNLMEDFTKELPGYLNNERMCKELQNLSLEPGTQNISANLRVCYEKLIELGVVGDRELELIDAWTNDLKAIIQ